MIGIGSLWEALVLVNDANFGRLFYGVGHVR